MEKAVDHVFNFGEVSIARFVVNGLRENTYVLCGNQGIIVIDCGTRTEAECQRVGEYLDKVIENKGGKDLKIWHLLTHCHFDHLWGAQWLYEHYGAAPTIPHGEVENYHCAQAMVSKVYHKEIELALPPEHVMNADSVGELHSPWGDYLKIITTPGHTMGSVEYYMPKEGILFSGDSLFKGYIGLPKEPGIPEGLMQQSLDEKIYTLPAGTLVLPGHGPELYL